MEDIWQYTWYLLIRTFYDSKNMKKPSCPSCKSGNTCPIVYGYPVNIKAFFEAAAKKEIYPAGCVVEENSPGWFCNDCELRWGERDEE